MGYHEVKTLFKNKAPFTSNYLKKISKYLRAHGKPWIERVIIPSLSIIYPPYSEYLENGFFLYFFPFLLDEIKVGGDSCLPRHFANTKCKMQTSIKQSVLPPYHTIFYPQVIQEEIPQCGVNLGHVFREIHMVFGIHYSAYSVLPFSQLFRV